MKALVRLVRLGVVTMASPLIFMATSCRQKISPFNGVILPEIPYIKRTKPAWVGNQPRNPEKCKQKYRPYQLGHINGTDRPVIAHHPLNGGRPQCANSFFVFWPSSSYLGFWASSASPMSAISRRSGLNIRSPCRLMTSEGGFSVIPSSLNARFSASFGCGLCLLIALAGAAQAQTPTVLAADKPISAIDWLSDTLDAPRAPVATAPQPSDIAENALPENVSVVPLDTPGPDAAGLLPSAVTGLPRDLWGLRPPPIWRAGSPPFRPVPIFCPLRADCSTRWFWPN